MRLVPLALMLAVLLAAGCGSSEESATPDTAAPGRSEPVGTSAGPADLGKPADTLSEPAGSAGYRLPPPAWIEASTGSHWLGGTTFCWGEVGCGDFEPPACGGGGVPEVTLEAGEVVVLRLPYEPSKLELRVWPPEGSQAAEPIVTRLDASPIATWEAPTEDSIVYFTAKAAEGHGSYQACVRVRAARQTLCTTEPEQRTGVPRAVIEPSGGQVAVPAVEGNSLPGAICRLLSVGLRVAIPSFASAPIDRLEDIVVVRTTPSPRVGVEAGSVVTFEEFTGVFTDTPPPVPDTHPATLRVPNVVGLSYSEAVRALELGGLFPIVNVSELPPLPPEASGLGIDAYRVAAQSREPGSELPWPSNPSVGTVGLTLELRP